MERCAQVRLGEADVKRLWISDLGFWIARRRDEKNPLAIWSVSESSNPKSKIHNSKWAAVAVAFLMAGSVHAAGVANWQSEWERTVDAAKTEGKLTLYGSPEYEGLYAELHKKYPEIKITGVFNRGADVAKRLMAERRAEKYLADLYLDGMTTGYNVFYKAKVLEPIPPQLVLPDVTDGSKWWRGKLQFVDPENQYLLNFNGENRMVVAFNSKLVNAAEIQSYLELLNKAPNPNAAKLGLNWLLTREGQSAYQRLFAQGNDGPDSMRIDIPKDKVPRGNRRPEVDDGRAPFVDRAEWMDQEPISKFVKEVLEQRKR